MNAGTISGWTLIAFLFLVLPATMYHGRQRAIAADAVAQQKRSNFAAKYNCRPEGYVASASEYADPIRTYRCDNGLFIAKDMEE